MRSDPSAHPPSERIAPGVLLLVGGAVGLASLFASRTTDSTDARIGILLALAGVRFLLASRHFKMPRGPALGPYRSSPIGMSPSKAPSGVDLLLAALLVTVGALGMFGHASTRKEPALEIGLELLMVMVGGYVLGTEGRRARVETEA